MMQLHVPHMHMPTWHEMAERASQLLHDRRFWAIVAAASLIAFLLLLAFLTRGSTGQQTPMHFYHFGYPYIP